MSVRCCVGDLWINKEVPVIASSQSSGRKQASSKPVHISQFWYLSVERWSGKTETFKTSGGQRNVRWVKAIPGREQHGRGPET